jgi:putative addiction module component (TIGR02574 family)
MKLSPADRAWLADRLMESLAEPDSRVMKAWAAEGERRLASYRAGEVSAVDGNAVIEALRKKRG